MARHLITKCLLIGFVSSALSGCLGGSIAQQIVSSMLMKGADKATAMSLDAQERTNKEAAQKMPLKDTAPDPYKVAFLKAGFENVTIKIEPLPEVPLEAEKPVQMMQETRLVQVEIWNLLIGDEKQQVFEKAQSQGAVGIPPKSEWQQWQIAIGGTENNKQAITFLIPPEMGKVHSGEKAVVELSSLGELNIARYTLN